MLKGKYTTEHMNREGHKCRKRNQVADIVGETNDGRCWKLLWPGSKTPYTVHKSFIDIVSDKEQATVEEFRKMTPYVQGSDIQAVLNHDLLPCPFCGNTTTVTYGERNNITGNIVYHAGCSIIPGCGASITVCLGGEQTADAARQQVVEKWNKRQPAP